MGEWGVWEWERFSACRNRTGTEGSSKLVSADAPFIAAQLKKVSGDGRTAQMRMGGPYKVTPAGKAIYICLPRMRKEDRRRTAKSIWRCLAIQGIRGTSD